MGNRVKPKLAAAESEPMNPPCYEWIDWCIARIEEALAAGEPPPEFKRPDRWSWILLSSTLGRRPELRRKVRVDSLAQRVEWEPPDNDAPAA
jgi:hypothetical protein